MVNLKPILAGLVLAGCVIVTPLRAAETAPPALILAEVYRAGLNPADYWGSEKRDGVRACWDGRQLWFRSGNPVPAPTWFTQGIPALPLDGELWLGRGQFERLSGIVRKAEPVDAEWRLVRYMLFELPGDTGTFTERKDRLVRLASESGVPWLQAVEQFRLADRKALLARQDEVFSTVAKASCCTGPTHAIPAGVAKTC